MEIDRLKGRFERILESNLNKTVNSYNPIVLSSRLRKAVIVSINKGFSGELPFNEEETEEIKRDLNKKDKVYGRKKAEKSIDDKYVRYRILYSFSTRSLVLYRLIDDFYELGRFYHDNNNPREELDDLIAWVYERTEEPRRVEDIVKQR